ncbi:Tryptophanase [Labilithrix luteola]|uniref:Tryptophanase n=1 Tax=Labilithrix luteola TaxID=1391654 RepID=A0A0K1PW57_9BACT|nr:radical SAM protein [Labilithrix luteola]AKU97374.1 Tryptophanase [Labilithrix luteola]
MDKHENGASNGAGARTTRPRVVLVNTNQIRPSVAPIAFDYLHEPLVEAGFEVDLLDLCFAEDWEAEIDRYCRLRRVDFWGVTLRNTDDVYFSSQHSFVPVARKMIDALRRGSPVPVTMGGVGFSIMPQKILEACGADFGIVCEGEVAFPALLTRLLNGQAVDDLPNLVYRTDKGIVRNDVQFADLGKLSSHGRRLINNERYFLHGGQAAVETKRGCNRRCIYCVEPLTKGRKLRLHTPEQVADQVQSLVERGIYTFHVNDSEFNLSIQHPIAVCNELIRRGLHKQIEWYAYGMPAPFPDELAARMREAGCVGMNFGTDSASEKMLRILRRTFTKDDIRTAVETSRRHGFKYIIELLFGAPGETGETVKETLDYMEEIDAHRVSVTAGLRIFPGTELERMVRAEGLSRDNPNLYGPIEGNEDLIQPLFYLPTTIAEKPLEYIDSLTKGKERFFGVNSDGFNYNANDLLVEAIDSGARGAYWAILSETVDARRAALAANPVYAGDNSRQGSCRGGPSLTQLRSPAALNAERIVRKQWETRRASPSERPRTWSW